MSREILVERVIAAPIETVWEDIARLETHTEWMADAESITFLTEQTAGEGTRMEVETRVGPLRTKDIMEFVEWEPPTRMAIRHQGLVTGVGEFTLTPEDGSTRFAWREELRFPWYFGGPVGELFAAPILKAIWRRNLDGLARRHS